MEALEVGVRRTCKNSVGFQSVAFLSGHPSVSSRESATSSARPGRVPHLGVWNLRYRVAMSQTRGSVPMVTR